MSLDRDEAGRDHIHSDAELGELARPTSCETDLGAFCGDVGGPARGRPVDDLGVDLDDAAGLLRLHSGEHGSEEQYRAYYGTDHK